MSRFRQPLTPPASRDAAIDVQRIRFRHPAYPESTPDLLQLCAVDGYGSDADGGIDYDTAFVACCLVTGNTWRTGWLALKEIGADGATFRRVGRPDDAILREPVYYFCLGDSDPCGRNSLYFFATISVDLY